MTKNNKQPGKILTTVVQAITWGIFIGIALLILGWVWIGVESVWSMIF